MTIKESILPEFEHETDTSRLPLERPGGLRNVEAPSQVAFYGRVGE
jgi:hypothetical protein